jgi:hypothetical protein
MEATSVVGGIFLTSDQLFGKEQLTVGTCTHLFDYSGLQIDADVALHILAGTSLQEEV